LAAQYDIPEISLYGGEPLYDLENCVFPIIDYIKQNYKDKITLSFVSNGLNFTRELKDKLKDIKW
jgi:sulfatase maturation enzyme AslB (radical SAM superfamily)